ncbi:homeobox protein NANOG-like [Pelodiscus sinensis]|uniref:Homeobox protein NANOG-like n=1 Tax=Pelodiscus sinensis TaxID=13735 RepID=K7FZG2_PELSI|nr:homeobox protein NANOG-like [Pelodiscus sinensis]|eukprot:XP_006119992.1 homeobox protein NANOG-like [Pelodiscus sinensis]
MSAHLAMPLYQPYPSGTGMSYGEFYWNSAGGTERAASWPGRGAVAAGDAQFPEEERQNPDLSPASSSSGNFSHFTPDSATSPQTESSPPQPASKLQKDGKEGEKGVKKAKSRTAFSKEQLKTLHQRFQSQKYLSTQEMLELATALGLTYKQVKTWFQNRRMKLKTYEKHNLWSERAQYLMQTGFQPSEYLEVHPKFHQNYPISLAGTIQDVVNPHQNYSSGQNPYAFIASEEGGVFGKGGATCSVQQTVGFIAQRKVDFYHGFSGTMEYTGAKTGDGYSFHASATVAPFPGTAGHHLYLPEAELMQMAQSNCH